MKRFFSVVALAAVTLVAAALPSFAEATKWSFDGVHSEAGFSIRHIFTKVPGRFDDMSGSIVFDEKNPSKSTVQATIQAKSINTRNERRDNHLRSADFFDVEKFPTLDFKSTKVEAGKEKNSYKVTGDLTMHGVTKSVVLDVSFLGAGDFGMGGNTMGKKAGFEARTKVNRKDFALLWNKTLDQGGTLLGDDVDITLAIEADAVKEEAAK
ncbi:MAG: YceI family protein [Candidatus Eisenbacteria bacterium]|uniref:YceI family protein n=1 Tax=Eiseniibacteriota bacterium TaxID=2212470 RepID=A0A849SJR9_UNCEI|nr:YceI family protein [Candidatus Eisenbacteria bacterium]